MFTQFCGVLSKLWKNRSSIAEANTETIETMQPGYVQPMKVKWGGAEGRKGRGLGSLLKGVSESHGEGG